MPSTQPFGETTDLLEFGAWIPQGSNPNPNPTQIRDSPRKPKPASIPNPAIDRLLTWALISALEGHHENAVASALAVSLERTLTIANAQSPRGPNSNV